MAIIIYPPTIDWDYMRQRPQNLMLEFAKNGHRVFYCNMTQSSESSIEQISDNLYLVHNVDIFLKEHIPIIKSSGIPVIVWCSWAMISNTLPEFMPDVTVYDCLDEFTEWLPHEPGMVRSAGIVFCSSDYLLGRLTSTYPEKKVSLLNNACEFARFGSFNGAVRPDDLPEYAGATIGYIGAWAWWIDDELVKKICARFPQNRLVVIGPNLGARLPREHPNFQYLGMKKYEQLVNYLKFIDVCIIPFKINKTTIATNPIKAYEYLAAGKNIVSTAIPELVKMQPLVRIGYDHEQFILQVEESLKNVDEGFREKRDFSRANSWEARYRSVEKVLETEIPGFKEDSAHSSLQKIIPSHDSNFLCIYPIADAVIKSSHPEANFDLSPVFIGRSGRGINRYLLKFDVTDIAREIERAVFAIFVERCSEVQSVKCLEVLKILGKWDEGLVSWKTRPPAEKIPIREFYCQGGAGWVEWDATCLLKEWIECPETNFGMMIKAVIKEKPFIVKGLNRHYGKYYSPKMKIFLKNMTFTKN
ncbi:MAG: hypothetical protein CVU89_07945 [Firmicutes bacterium HGW-Firmicutes-14]|nr:MAG: hypothetical protein CVU89_07945 [Firmicutes bacterium HGW-Firmicutes-14]